MAQKITPAQDTQTLQNGPRAQMAYRRERAAARRWLASQRDLVTPGHYQQLVKQDAEQSARALQALKNQLGEAKRRLQSDVDWGRGYLGRSENVAALLAAQNSWQSIRQVLDALPGHQERLARLNDFITQAKRQGNPSVLRGIQLEARNYFEAHEEAWMAEARARAGKSYEDYDIGLQAALHDSYDAPGVLTDVEIAGQQIADQLKAYDRSIGSNFGQLDVEANGHPEMEIMGMIDWDGSYLVSGLAEDHDTRRPSVSQFRLSDTDPETGAPIPGSK